MFTPERCEKECLQFISVTARVQWREKYANCRRLTVQYFSRCEKIAIPLSSAPAFRRLLLEDV